MSKPAQLRFRQLDGDSESEMYLEEQNEQEFKLVDLDPENKSQIDSNLIIDFSYNQNKSFSMKSVGKTDNDPSSQMIQFKQHDNVEDNNSLISDYSCFLRVGKNSKFEFTPHRVTPEGKSLFQGDLDDTIIFEEQQEEKHEDDNQQNQIEQPEKKEKEVLIHHFSDVSLDENDNSMEVDLIRNEKIESDYCFFYYTTYGLFPLDAVAIHISDQHYQLVKFKQYKDFTNFKQDLKFLKTVEGQQIGHYFPKLKYYYQNSKLIVTDYGQFNLQNYRIQRSQLQLPFNKSELIYILERVTKMVLDLERHGLYLTNLNEKDLVLHKNSSGLYDLIIGEFSQVYVKGKKTNYPAFYTPTVYDRGSLQELKKQTNPENSAQIRHQNEMFMILRLMQRLIQTEDFKFRLEQYLTGFLSEQTENFPAFGEILVKIYNLEYDNLQQLYGDITNLKLRYLQETGLSKIEALDDSDHSLIKQSKREVIAKSMTIATYKTQEQILNLAVFYKVVEEFEAFLQLSIIYEENEKLLNYESRLEGFLMLAEAYYLVGELKKSKEFYKLSKSILDKYRPNTKLIQVNFSLLQIALDLQEPQESTQLMQEITQMVKKSCGESHPNHIKTIQYLGMIKQSEKSFAEAIRLLEKSYYLSNKYLQSDPVQTQLIKVGIGNCYCKLKNWNQALKNYQTALKNLEKLFDETTMDTIRIRENIAGVYSQSNQIDNADQEYNLIIEMKQKIVNPNSEEMARTYYNYSVFLIKVEKIEQAHNYLTEAKRIFSNNPRRNHQYLQMIQKQLSKIQL